MLGSVESTTFSQIRDVTNSGKCIVVVPKERIPATFSDLITVEIQRRGRSRVVKTTYSLDELKDLQSKLALIRGNITDDKIWNMATAFWQVCAIQHTHTNTHSQTHLVILISVGYSSGIPLMYYSSRVACEIRYMSQVTCRFPQACPVGNLRMAAWQVINFCACSADRLCGIHGKR